MTTPQPPRRGLLYRIGQAHWGWFVGIGAVLAAVGIARDVTSAIVQGVITMLLGVVLRVLRGR